MRPTFPLPLDADDDHPKEECGVFGIFGEKEAANYAALGLHALQHRGQEAAGIVSYDGANFLAQRGEGHVSHVFRDEKLSRLQGDRAVGHVRYSTAGGANFRNIQPLFATFEFGGLAVSHNGNLTNALALRKDLVHRGSLFQSTSDTEVILHLIARSEKTNVEDRLVDALRQVEGAYSLVVMTEKKLMGVRDPMGVRPLVLGRLDGSYILCSETCALDLMGAEFVRDIAPGELVVITDQGLKSLRPFRPQPPKLCIFEYIYFARPDSVIEGKNVYTVRLNIGKELARESPVDADVVVPVPDSGVPAALGYARAIGIPFDYGIIRNHYVGRTFIQPTAKTRQLDVKRKLNANREVLAGKRVVLVDDSIVRGTTSLKIVEMVRQAGASEVHLRISSPPTSDPCFYGIDTPSRENLIAAQLVNVEAIARELKVDSLAYISLSGLYRAVGEVGRNAECPQFCDACFTGVYPILPHDHHNEQPSLPYSQLSENSDPKGE